MMFPGVNHHYLPNMAFHSSHDVESRGLVRCCLKRKREDHHGNSCLKKSKVFIQPENTFWVGKKKRSSRGKASKFCSVPDLNLVPEDSEFNEKEAALCLIMLSSGFTTWDDFVSGFDSSEDDPLISKAVALNRIDTNSVAQFDSHVPEIGIQVESGKGGVLESVQADSGFDSSEHDPLISKAVALNRIDTNSVIEFDSRVSEIGVESGKGGVLESVQADSVVKYTETSSSNRDTELGLRIHSSYLELGDFSSKKPVDNVFEITSSGSEIRKEKFSTSEPVGVESGNRAVFESVEADSRIKSGEISSRNQDIEIGIRLHSSSLELSFGNESKNKKPADNVSETTFYGSEITKENKFSTSEPGGVESGNATVLESSEAHSVVKFGETCSLNIQDTEFGDFSFRNEFKKPVEYVFETTSSAFRIRKQNKFGTSDKISFVSGSSGNCDEKSEIKCKTCDKKFSSFQALGGHRAGKCKEKSEGIKVSCAEKKNKSIHQCTICFKVFPTGQALGGHKRAHFNGFPESKSEERMVVMSRESAIDVPDFSSLKQFGLSLGLKPWWSEPVMI